MCNSETITLRLLVEYYSLYGTNNQKVSSSFCVKSLCHKICKLRHGYGPKLVCSSRWVWQLLSVGFMLWVGVALGDEPEVESESGNIDSPTQDSQTQSESDDGESFVESDEKRSDNKVLESLQDILDYESTDADYKLTNRCIDRRDVEDYDILSQRFVVVQMRNDKEKYLIQLSRKCIGLTKGALLSFDTRRSGTLRMCANDTIRASMGTEWGPPCRIPGFEPVNDVQLEQLTRGIYSGRVE